MNDFRSFATDRVMWLSSQMVSLFGESPIDFGPSWFGPGPVSPGAACERDHYFVIRVKRPTGEPLEIGATCTAVASLSLDDMWVGLYAAIQQAYMHRESRWIIGSDRELLRFKRSDTIHFDSQSGPFGRSLRPADLNVRSYPDSWH